MPHLPLLGVSSRVPSTLLTGAVLAGTAGVYILMGFSHARDSQSRPTVMTSSNTHASTMLQQQVGCFVPNLGQWEHRAKFVHRSGPMTLCLEDRGWVLNLVQPQLTPKGSPDQAHPLARTRWGQRHVDQNHPSVALRMTFEGDAHVPAILGEQQLPGHHNYYLGNDRSYWRSRVPLYGSVRYANLYPGIDIRLREVDGVPEYDLLLEPGADLSRVRVHVQGATRLFVAENGALVIETALGPLCQARPKTWQVGHDGTKHEVPCNFTILGPDRFGFSAPGWNGNTALAIDPALIWSTTLGGSLADVVTCLHLHGDGTVTIAGRASSPNSNYSDVFVSRLDPGKTANAQLVYATFLGGADTDNAVALVVDPSGVVTLLGDTFSANFPTTSGAYDTTHNGFGTDMFVSRLDPNKSGSGQLVYSTLLGGKNGGAAGALFVHPSGVVTLTGLTGSSDFPTTVGAFDTTYNGGLNDAIVCRLDPSKTGSAQLVYSTFLGGTGIEEASALDIDVLGIVTAGGYTGSTDFPTTSNAYDSSAPSAIVTFVSRLDLTKTGTGQLVYSTILGPGRLSALSVDSLGKVVTMAGGAAPGFPTTKGAFDETYNDAGNAGDAFVSRLDLTRTGRAQLVYSTFLGGISHDEASSIAVQSGGVVTVAGRTTSFNFPTTNGAFDTVFNLNWNSIRYDAFVSRLDPSKTGTAQLVYSTFLGGDEDEVATALVVDPGGVATVAGFTNSYQFPTTSGAFSKVAGFGDGFVSRLSMGMALYADVHEISASVGGTQTLTLEAGQSHANRSYWIFGSVTGTTPGVTLGSAIGPVHIPLNPDIWTDYTIALANTPTLTNTKATLDASGTAQASINIPKVPSAVGLILNHAYVVYDANNNLYMASNPVPLKLVK